MSSQEVGGLAATSGDGHSDERGGAASLASVSEAAFPISGLRVESFRCFTGLSWDNIDPGFNVIVAPNGGGKTALLDAIAIGLAPFPRFRAKTAGWNITDWDVPRIRSAGGTTMRADDDVVVSITGPQPTPAESSTRVRTWRISKGPSANNRTRTNEAADLSALAKRAFTARRAGSPLPAVAYYGTQRLWGHQSLTTARLGREVEDGYSDCLDPRVSFGAFEKWIAAISHDRLNRATGAAAERQWVFLEKLLTATLLPVGVSQFEYSAQENSLMLSDGAGPFLPAHRLSDGTRTLLGLVGDLARRICLLNSDLDIDLQDTPGIVIVDEIDLHLHPSWQQRVVAGIRSAFPRIQWIVTTHSQQVVSTVERGCVWEFQVDGSADGSTVTLVHPAAQTEGEDSTAVLASVFDVDSLPDTKWRQMWNELDSMVDADAGDPRLDALVGALTAHFGDKHQKLAVWRARRASRRRG